MKTYRATFNKELKGVYGISLVSEPAMEGDFLTFKKQDEIKFAEVDKEKRILMGLVLEPNKLIYRNQGGEEFNVFFTEQDIEDVAHNFQKQAAQSNSTLEHSGERIEGVTFVEQWIITDPKIDKSANFGLNYPKGSWMAMMKVENDEIWNDYIKSGKVSGFSIDALMKFEEVKLNKQVNMSDNKKIMDSVLEAIKLGFASIMPGNTKKEGSIETEDGKTVIHFNSEKLTSESEVWTLNDKEEKVNLSKDSYILSGNLTLSVDDKGVIESIKETKEPEVKKVEFSDINGVVEFTAAVALSVKEMLEPLSEKNIELAKQVETLSEKVVELGKKPAAKSISSAPAQLDYSKMSNVEKMNHNSAK